MTPSTPQLTNIQAIVCLERETRDGRSALERVTGEVNSLGHATFDRYPFSLLTLTVSLEAIVLTGFVLMSQRHMTREADRRAHLDLQINLLAEQELTAILKLQCLLAERAGIDVTSVDPRLDELRTHTDVQQLAATIATEMAASEPPAVDSNGVRV